MNSSDFELRLGSQLRELAQHNLTSIDPLATAQAVVGQPRGLRLARRSPDAWRLGRLVWIAALICILAVSVLAIVYVGSHRNTTVPTATPRATDPALVTGTPKPSATVRDQQLAVIRHGELFLGSTTGTLYDAGVRRAIDNPDNGLPSQSDLKAVRWSPEGSRLLAAAGQQPGDPLWHGLALIKLDGTLTSMGAGAFDFTWAHDADHVVLLPISPLGQQRPVYAGLDAFPQGLGSLNESATVDLGITQPGLPLGAGWQGADVVVMQADVLLQQDGYVSDPNKTVTVWLASVAADRPAENVLTTHGSLAAAVDPSGSLVALVDHTSLTVAPLDGSSGCTISLLDTTAEDNAISPSVEWSPRGSSVAVALSSGGQSGLWIVPADCSSSMQLVTGTYEPGDTYLDAEIGADSTPLNSTSGEYLRGPLAWDESGFIYYTALTAADEGNPVSPPDLDLRRVSTFGGASELVASGVEYFDLK